MFFYQWRQIYTQANKQKLNVFPECILTHCAGGAREWARKMWLTPIKCPQIHTYIEYKMHYFGLFIMHLQHRQIVHHYNNLGCGASYQKKILNLLQPCWTSRASRIRKWVSSCLSPSLRLFPKTLLPACSGPQEVCGPNKLQLLQVLILFFIYRTIFFNVRFCLNATYLWVTVQE